MALAGMPRGRTLAELAASHLELGSPLGQRCLVATSIRWLASA